MAEVAPAPPAVPAKVPRKKAASKNKRSGLAVGEPIVKAVSKSKERNGMFLTALKKHFSSGGDDVEKNNLHFKFAFRGLVNKDILIQTTGTGVSGSFKLNKKQTEAKKAMKKAAPKVKKVATRKSAVPKKPKKAKTKKADAKKSPKKQNKPAAKKLTNKVVKKSVTPKRVTKSPEKVRSVKPKTVKSKAKKATDFLRATHFLI